MRKQNNGLLFHVISLKVQAFVTVLSVNVYLQQRVLGFAHGTTVRQLLVLPQHFGTCDHPDAEDQKDESHLAQVDVQDTPIQTAATRLSGLGTR
jgi:hypothetical protein